MGGETIAAMRKAKRNSEEQRTPNEAWEKKGRRSWPSSLARNKREGESPCFDAASGEGGRHCYQRCETRKASWFSASVRKERTLSNSLTRKYFTRTQPHQHLLTQLSHSSTLAVHH